MAEPPALGSYVDSSFIITSSKVFILGVLIVSDCKVWDILPKIVSVELTFCTNSCSLSLGRLLGRKWGAEISFGSLEVGLCILSIFVVTISICCDIVWSIWFA